MSVSDFRINTAPLARTDGRSMARRLLRPPVYVPVTIPPVAAHMTVEAAVARVEALEFFMGGAYGGRGAMARIDAAKVTSAMGGPDTIGETRARYELAKEALVSIAAQLGADDSTRAFLTARCL